MMVLTMADDWWYPMTDDDRDAWQFFDDDDGYGYVDVVDGDDVGGVTLKYDDGDDADFEGVGNDVAAHDIQ